MAANISTGRAVVKIVKTKANTPENTAIIAILCRRFSMKYSATMAVNGKMADNTITRARAMCRRIPSLMRLTSLSDPTIGSYYKLVSMTDLLADVKLTTRRSYMMLGRRGTKLSSSHCKNLSSEDLFDTTIRSGCSNSSYARRSHPLRKSLPPSLCCNQYLNHLESETWARSSFETRACWSKQSSADV